MPKLTFVDRLACGVAGILFGAVIGFALSWLLGVYSNTLGPGRAPIDIGQWILWSSGLFGFIGLAVGPAVGSLIGTLIASIYHFENAANYEKPSWLVLCLLLAFGAGAWWWLSS